MNGSTATGRERKPHDREWSAIRVADRCVVCRSRPVCLDQFIFPFPRMLPLDSAIRSASAGTTGVAWGVRNVAHFERGGPGVNPIARAPRFSYEQQLFHPGVFADCSQNHPLDREKTPNTERSAGAERARTRK